MHNRKKKERKNMFENYTVFLADEGRGDTKGTGKIGKV